MLERLERGYLGLLRIIILILATCALIAAGAAILTAVTEKVRSARAESQSVSGGDLASFIQQQKDASTAEKGEGASTVELGEGDPIVLPDIRTAAKNLVTYLGKRSEIPYRDMAKLLQEKADTLELEGTGYASDLKSLTEQLKASKGKPLSLTRVGNLVDWHFTNYKLSIERAELEKAEARSKLQIAIGVAAAAFVSFLLTIFVFIFVKIERNLRVVRMTVVDVEEVVHA